MDDIERIRLHLQKRHANFFVRAYLQVMLGLALSAVAPCLIVIFVAVICRLWRWNMPTSWVALAAAAVTLPWLFWTEIQAQGGLAREVTDEFNAAEQKKADPPTFAHLGTLGKALARQRTPISGPMEILLFGPNLVVSAMRKLRLRRLSEPAGAERIVQVADALCKLQGGAATE